MIPHDPERATAAARRWVGALWSGRTAEAFDLLSPRFGRHNGWDAAHYLRHEQEQYQRHAPFAGWDHGWDVRVAWAETLGCWSVAVLDAQGDVSTRFWWWWDEHGVGSNGWPFQMIPKLSWGAWGVRRKITHDARGWNVLPVGACEDLQHEHHEEADGFEAISWSWSQDRGDTACVRVHAQRGTERFKTLLELPGRQENGYQDALFPRLDDRAVWVPPTAHAFALDVRTDHGHVHLAHPPGGWIAFDAPVERATLTDRLDHDWTVSRSPN